MPLKTETSTLRRQEWATRSLTIAVVAVLMLVFVAPSAGSDPTGELIPLPDPDVCIAMPGSQDDCVRAVAFHAPFGVTVSPDGANVYVAARGDDAVAVFDRNPETGQLSQKTGTAACVSSSRFRTECAAGVGLDDPYTLTVSPDGRHVYAVSSSSHAVAVLDRDLTTGALTQRTGLGACITHEDEDPDCTPGRALAGPEAVAVSPDGRTVYVAAGYADAVAVFDRDTTTGALTQKAGGQGCITESAGDGTCTEGRALDHPSDVRITSDGAHVYVASNRSDAVSVFNRDPDTGALTQKAGTAGCVADSSVDGCAEVRVLGSPSEIAVSPDDANLYVALSSNNAIAVVSRDSASGKLTLAGDGIVGGIGLEHTYAIAVTPNGRQVVATGSRTDAVVVFDRDDSSGQLVQKPRPAGCVSDTGTDGQCTQSRGLDAPWALALAPDGRHAYVTSSADAALTSFSICAEHHYSDVPSWVDDAVTWASCHAHMSGYADDTFRSRRWISRAETARLLYRAAGSPDVATLPDHGLTDVPAWVDDAVTWLKAQSYMTGYPDGTFRPGLPVSRGQVARASYRIHGSPPSFANALSDVPRWLRNTVNWATHDPDGDGPARPLMTGYPNATFRPDVPMDRAQTVRLTCRANTDSGLC